MIRYTLQCSDGHSFDSWFASASAFDTLERAGHLSCALCGSAKVKKSLMAPRVVASDTGVGEADAPLPVLSDPQSNVEKEVAALRKKVEANSDYVGSDFTDQARAMHDGDAPRRAIYGEARIDQAKALVEDGVPVVPLPFGPKQKLS